jgi:hypothetical protein
MCAEVAVCQPCVNDQLFILHILIPATLLIVPAVLMALFGVRLSRCPCLRPPIVLLRFHKVRVDRFVLFSMARPVESGASAKLTAERSDCS